jgi:hypothetical protein
MYPTQGYVSPVFAKYTEEYVSWWFEYLQLDDNGAGLEKSLSNHMPWAISYGSFKDFYATAALIRKGDEEKRITITIVVPGRS